MREIWEKDDRVYYLDLDSDKGWIESDFRLPAAGISSVLMMDKETVYVLPFYSTHSNYYVIKIDQILPKELIQSGKGTTNNGAHE